VSSLLHERPVLTHQSRTHHHTIPRRCPSPYTPHPIPHATVQKMEPHDIKPLSTVGFGIPPLDPRPSSHFSFLIFPVVRRSNVRTTDRTFGRPPAPPSSRRPARRATGADRPTVRSIDGSIDEWRLERDPASSASIARDRPRAIDGSVVGWDWCASRCRRRARERDDDDDSTTRTRRERGREEEEERSIARLSVHHRFTREREDITTHHPSSSDPRDPRAR